EAKLKDDHKLLEETYPVSQIAGDSIIQIQAPALNAINERLRDDYIEDCQRGIDKWNKIIRNHGIDFTLRLPHRGFHRAIGLFSNVKVSPDGNLLKEAEWDRSHGEWLPTNEDRDYVISLMAGVTEPGKVANWIAPPAKGINAQPLDFDYVRLS
ncbi:MAG: benzoyl-CoA 2,3-epoxidase subunit BoxB, partial [Alphaproteobacteria bacterium]